MEISTGSKLQLKDIWILKYNLWKMIYFATTRLFYIWKYVTWVVINSQSSWI